MSLELQYPKVDRVNIRKMVRSVDLCEEAELVKPKRFSKHYSVMGFQSTDYLMVKYLYLNLWHDFEAIKIFKTVPTLVNWTKDFTEIVSTNWTQLSVVYSFLVFVTKKSHSRCLILDWLYVLCFRYNSGNFFAIPCFFCLDYSESSEILENVCPHLFWVIWLNTVSLFYVVVCFVSCCFYLPGYLSKNFSCSGLFLSQSGRYDKDQLWSGLE